MLRQGGGDDAAQPDYYLWTKAALAIGMSAPQLNALPEPARTFWFERGLVIHNAEAKAANAKD